MKTTLHFYFLHILKSDIVDLVFTICRRFASRMRIAVQVCFQIVHHIVYLTVSIQRRTRVIQVANSLKIEQSILEVAEPRPVDHIWRVIFCYAARESILHFSTC